jgi:hypothetical protein
MINAVFRPIKTIHHRERPLALTSAIAVDFRKEAQKYEDNGFPRTENTKLDWFSPVPTQPACNVTW